MSGLLVTSLLPWWPCGPSPVSIERVVVFPAPLWPSRTVICPSYRFRFRSLTAALPLFPTLNTCRKGRAALDFRGPQELTPGAPPTPTITSQQAERRTFGTECWLVATLPPAVL